MADNFFLSHFDLIKVPAFVDKRFIDEVLDTCSEHGASDIVLIAGTQIRARVGTELVKVTDGIIESESLSAFVIEVETQQLLTAVESGKPRSFAYRLLSNGKVKRFRMSLASVIGARSGQGLRLVARPIPGKPPRLHNLNLPDELSAALTTPLNKGIILISGETGSGKTTLLGAVIDSKARGKGLNITTLEDPVEFVLYYLNEETHSTVSQSALGANVESFSVGLRGLLRDNPDVIMVGEMRDADTIKLAVEASRTGHLVYSTIHVNSVSGIVERMSVGFDSAEAKMIASTVIGSLRTGVNQELVDRVCPECSAPVVTLDPILKELNLSLKHALEPNLEGCPACRFTGFKGRTPIIEYLVLNNQLRDRLGLALITDGIGAVTAALQEMVESEGVSKCKAATVAFEQGLICQETLKHIYLEYRALEVAGD